MSTELMLDVGQANELKLAFRREGAWTNEEIKMLCERKGFLTTVHDVLLGRCEMKMVSYTIDLDAAPMIPDGWKVESHTKGGQFKFDSSKIDGTYLSEEQKNGGCLEGNKLRKKLQGKNPYNANLLDFYLAHPELIPDSWKGKAIFFWGTIYRNAAGRLYVRCLYWNGGQWYWGCPWLGNAWDGYNPAAVPSK